MVLSYPNIGVFGVCAIGKNRVVKLGTVRYGTVRYGTVRYGTVPTYLAQFFRPETRSLTLGI
jgi:hypothetical protein